jgi:hypothetical protein
MYNISLLTDSFSMNCCLKICSIYSTCKSTIHIYHVSTFIMNKDQCFYWTSIEASIFLVPSCPDINISCIMYQYLLSSSMACNNAVCVKHFVLDHPLSSKNRIYIWRAQRCFMRFVLNCSLLEMLLLLYLRCAECGNVACLFIHVG